MSPTTKSALIFASLFVIVKMILFNTGMHDKMYVAVVFSNILFVLLAMIMGLYLVKKANPSQRSYTEDVKTTMRAAGLYAIIISGFIYIYYSRIDRAFIENRISERVELAKQVDFEQLKKDNPEKLKNKTHQDFIDDEEENAKLWFSPFIVCTLTLIGLIILSLFYSLLIAWFWRKFFAGIQT